MIKGESVKKWLLQVPEGTRDILYADCAAKRRVEDLLGGVFAGAGYSEIVAPTLEYLDVFEEKNAIPVEEMYKLVDRHGRIMALRPDSTTPIARVAASRLREQPLPLRLYYTQNVLRAGEGERGRRSEFTQSGVELIGAAGLRADLEVLCTALSAMEAAGIKNYKLELGHVGFFKELLKQTCYSPEDAERIRGYIEYKNFAALSDLLSAYSGQPGVEALSRLPRLFGGVEVLREAAELSGGGNGALSYLEALYGSLSSMGLSEHISIDLGLVHHLDYYTGLVFGCYIEGSGEPVMSGGRYDGLVGAFGVELPAVGFAVNVDAVADCLSTPIPTKEPDILVHFPEDGLLRAMAYRTEREAEGLRCELSLCDSPEESRALAAKRGIATVAVLDGDKAELQRLV